MKDLKDIIKEQLRHIVTEQTRVSYRNVFELFDKHKLSDMDTLIRCTPKCRLSDGSIDVIVTANLTRSGKKAWLLNVKAKDDTYDLDITYKKS